MNHYSFVRPKHVLAIVFSLLSYSTASEAQSTIRANILEGPIVPGTIDLAPDPDSTIRLFGSMDAQSNSIFNLAQPNSASDAATKGYVDANDAALQGQLNDATAQLQLRLRRAVAMASVLDTRLPVDGKKYRISFDVSSYRGEEAVGVGFVGVVTGTTRRTAFDYSVSAAFANSEKMGKGGIGLSW